MVGLRRTEAMRRLAALPAGLAAGLVVVTAAGRPGARESPTLPDGPHWFEIDVDRRYREDRDRLGPTPFRGIGPRRILRLLRHPIRAVRHHRLEARRDALAVQAIHAGLLDALALVVDGDSPAEILPLDADDLAMVEPLLNAGARLHPSELTGLVDVWDAHGRPSGGPVRRHAYPMLSLAIADRAYAEMGDAPAEIDYPAAADGVPSYARDGDTYLHPVLAAQQGLRQLSTNVSTGTRVHLDRARVIAHALMAAAVESDGALWIPYGFDFRLHSRPTDLMRAPWYSAMAQGQVLSLVSRLYELTLDPRYLTDANAVFASFERVGRREEPWITWAKARYLWLEEYPGWPPDHTLNGFAFALYGIYDYHCITRSASAAEIFRAGLTTLDHYLPQFRTKGGISRYCLLHGVQSEKYHRIHVAQLRQLTTMTGDGRFATMAALFESDHR